MKLGSISAVATALALGMIAPAEAEDWTGGYLTFGISGTSFDMRENQTGASIPPFNTSSDDVAPYVAAGYDWAYGNLTFGVVGDIDLGGADSSDLVSSGKGVYGESDWFATFRGRVGVPVNDLVHVYASGGLAVMRAGATGNDIFEPAREAGSQTLTGAVAGLGMEYQLSQGRHLSLEYLYPDFERSNPLFDDGFANGTIDPNLSSIRLGLSFRF